MARERALLTPRLLMRRWRAADAEPLAALGDARAGDLENDLFDRARLRAHAAGAAHVADCAVTDGLRDELLAVDQLRVLTPRVEHAVTAEDLALVREVDRGNLETLGVDVLPHVELRPVRDREHAHVLALVDAPVVEVPQLRPLALRVPLAE